MTAKKTMTKAEALEFLKDKYVSIPDMYDGLRIILLYQRAGFIWDELPYDDEHQYAAVKSPGIVSFCSHKALPYNLTEIKLNDLLSIDIAEDPDPSELLKEAVKDIAKMVSANESLPIIAQLIAGWKATTPADEWTDFDQYCVEALTNIQITNEELKSKYTDGPIDRKVGV